MNKRVWSRIVIVCLLCCFLCVTAAAASDGSIAELQINENQAVAYVKDVGTVSGVSVAVGKTTCENVQFQTVEEAGITIRTLILVDNSLSIPEADRESIKEELLELIAGRNTNETFSVGTIGDQVTILQDYTDDYSALKTTLEGLEYQYQDTYLTDALYDYILPGNLTESGAFTRILLVSDGVDNKSIGYTKDELITLLEKQPILVYTLGIDNQTDESEDNLKNMFAIARATGAEYLLLSECGEETNVLSMLTGDRQDLMVTAELPEDVMDGSLQTLTVTLEGSGATQTVSLDQVRMPLVEKTEEPVEETETPTPTTTIQIVEVPVETEEEESSALPIALLVGCIVGVVLLIAAIVIAIVLIVRKKRRENAFQELSPDEELLKRFQQEEESTYMLDADNQQGDEQTMLCWEAGNTYRITLRDIHSQEHCYQKPIDRSLVIGFSRQSDICVNYDKSVSRKHCEIQREGDNFYIVNHSQSNGTLVNGSRVENKAPLANNSVIKMGRVELRVEISR